jgi:putative phosphotransacetylase
MMKVMVETSARHVHLSEQDLVTLFGEGAKLTNKKDLSQPGQFACYERVTVVGPKGEMAGVSILGPVRKDTQVELSLTDARKIGIAAPVRESGDIAGTPGCKLIGPAGEVEIPQGVIAAKRHIHLTPAVADEFGLTDKQVVSVRIEGTGRALTFGDVVVRVRGDFAPAMHIDTDEANAAGLPGTVDGEILA